MEGRMITILDLKAEFAKLTLLRGRTPQTTEVERKGSGAFATLAPFRDGNIFSAKFAGDGAWERHPNGDELVQIVDGSATLHTMTEDGPKSYAVSAGMIVIVPQGTWHRFHSPGGVSLMTATPKPTEHLTVDVEDPRTLTAASAVEHYRGKVALSSPSEAERVGRQSDGRVPSPRHPSAERTRSELFKRQIYATFQEDHVAITLIPFLGDGHLLWASDYPHPDRVWPSSREAIERQMRHLPPEMRRKLTHHDAAALSGPGRA